jgi:hypothetical protein
MFVYLLHDFSLEVFFYYFIFSLTYDTLDHSFFGGPDAWYMTCDSLISLVWILTLHLGAGKLLFTIQALMLTTCIWLLTTAFKIRASTRKIEKEQRERELADKAGFSEKTASKKYNAEEVQRELKEWGIMIRGAGTKEEKRKNAWYRENKEAVSNGNAPKIRIEEVESNVDKEEVGNWVPQSRTGTGDA